MVEERIAGVAEVIENAASLQRPADQLKYILEQAIDNVDRRRKYSVLLASANPARSGSRAVSLQQASYGRGARQFEIQCRIFRKPQGSRASQALLVLFFYPSGHHADDIHLSPALPH